MTNSKKIAVLCNYELLPERVGGMDHFFWQFDKKCKENNIQVDWFFPNSSDHGEYTNLTIFNSNYQNIESFFLEYCTQNKTEYSNIITHFVELCTSFFKKIKQFSAAKIIAVDHNPRPINGYPLKKKLEKKVKGFLYSKHIDLFVGVSNYTVNEILKDFGNQLKTKTITIYNGVIIDDILIRTERNSSKPSFLVASHLRESKGIQDLIVAVSILPETIKNQIKIDIFGDGPFKENLMNLTKKNKVTKCFEFMGSKSNLNELFCHYDYMLQPTSMECFSLSILESLAANVPVITTNVGGNEEAITTTINGYIFKAKDIKALSNIIEDLYIGKMKIEMNTRIAIENNFSLKQMVHQHFLTLK